MTQPTNKTNPTKRKYGPNLPKCGARKTKTGGDPCQRPAGWGTKHPGIGCCKLHGGSMKIHNEKAKRILAQRVAIEFGARLDIPPAQALLELVEKKAGEVEYWQQCANRLDPDQLTNGDRPAIEVEMLHTTQRDLERFASAALKAGATQAMIDTARAQGGLVIDVARRALTKAGILPDLHHQIITEVLDDLAATQPQPDTGR